MLYFILITMPIILQSKTPNNEMLTSHTKWPDQVNFWYNYGSELIYGCLLTMLYHRDLSALKNKFIYCEQCDYPVNIFYTQSCCLFDRKYKTLKTIRKLLYKTDPEKVIEFLLKFHNHYQSECPCCKSYFSWYRKINHNLP